MLFHSYLFLKTEMTCSWWLQYSKHIKNEQTVIWLVGNFIKLMNLESFKLKQKIYLEQVQTKWRFIFDTYVNIWSIVTICVDFVGWPVCWIDSWPVVCPSCIAKKKQKLKKQKKKTHQKTRKHKKTRKINIDYWAQTFQSCFIHTHQDNRRHSL